MHPVASIENVYTETHANVHTHTHTHTHNTLATLSPVAKEMSTPGNQKMYFYASIIIFPLLMILAY